MANGIGTGFALDELLGMKTCLVREAQRKSGGKQPQPTAGAAEKDAVSTSLKIFGVARRSREGDVPAKLGSTTTTKALRREYYRVGRESGGEQGGDAAGAGSLMYLRKLGS